MEKLLQPLKQEGFTEEIWKSLTAAPDTETDLLSDGEPRPSTTRSPEARGTKRTADGERKGSWGNTGYAEDEFIPAKVQSPPAAMPLEARAEGTDDEEEEYKPAMYIQLYHVLMLVPFRSWKSKSILQKLISPIVTFRI